MTLQLAGSQPSPASLEEAGLAQATLEPERLPSHQGARRFLIQPAVRRPVPLLFGLAGPSGSGKTYSALRLASGIARVARGEIVVIDTENQRAQHYADHFKFSHIDFAPPYGPMDYLAAIHTAERSKPACIIIDSLSHEHDGEGGTLDCVTAELDRLAGADTGLQQKLAAAAWRKPKAARRALLSGLLRLQSHVIVCIRANERTRMAREAVAIEPVDMGLTPIAAPEFLFELTASALLKAGAQGSPTWSSALPGEHAAIKLPRQFESVFKGSGPLEEGHGELLARWAAGEVLPAAEQSTRRSPPKRRRTKL
ncbi:MAG: AAA family ATPase [Hyphomonadaceae bacterium]|nr:AAA family ATPase [Hyphomonadaceae bacterium]